MISKRRKEPSDPFLIISVWGASNANSNLTLEQMMVLVTVHCLQQEQNIFPGLEDISARIGLGKQQVGIHLAKLIESKCIEKAGHNMYNVNESGEYMLRGVQIKINRMINGTKLSRWKMPKGVDKKYLRKPARKGNKII